MEHTELPCRLPWSTHFVSETDLWEVLSAESEILTTCNTYGLAAYIVRAANAFPAMMERLKKAVCPYCMGPCGKRAPDQHHCTWCDETRAVLAAGGE